MKNFGPYFLFVLVLAAVITLACGSPSSTVAACASTPTATNGAIPQSVSVCPAAADAQNYPGGLVQFAAIGDFTTSPSPALPKPVIWGACQNNQSTTGVTVSVTGVAQCASGASGTYTVWATATPVCNVISPCGECGPTGRAQLTCP
jgi:hypothetical protein